MGIWGCRVVVVDDDTATLEILSRVLIAQGAEVVAVDHPGGALATIVGVIPDVLLVNIGMPGLDGVSLIRKLRSLSPERGGRIPAATLSASPADEEQHSAWTLSGFQAHIVKPFDPVAVADVVASLAGVSVERRAQSADRGKWPTSRERRSERREPLERLQGIAAGDERLHRELA
jgi:CheY-like chemotaxis protein